MYRPMLVPATRGNDCCKVPSIVGSAACASRRQCECLMPMSSAGSGWFQNTLRCLAARLACVEVVVGATPPNGNELRLLRQPTSLAAATTCCFRHTGPTGRWLLHPLESFNFECSTHETAPVPTIPKPNFPQLSHPSKLRTCCEYFKYLWPN